MLGGAFELDDIGYLMPEHLRVVDQAIIAQGRNPSAVSKGEQGEVDLQRVDVQGTGQRLPGTLRESCAPRERLVKSMQTGGQVNAITQLRKYAQMRNHLFF